jgi:hypothetical protein
MTPDEFEDRVHELLDARVDPLADDRCVDYLAEHPEHLAEFAVQQERLAALPAVAPSHRSLRGQRRMLPLVLAGIAALAFCVLRPFFAAAGARPPGVVIAASLQPIWPTLGATTTVRARTVLLAPTIGRLEVFSQWSTP